MLCSATEFWPVLPPTLSDSAAAAKSSSESMGKSGKEVMSVGIEISRLRCELSDLRIGER